MNLRPLLLPLFWLFAPTCLVCAAMSINPPVSWLPLDQQDLKTYTIYAYRDWQSVGIFLEQGDQYLIRASGQWQYSPIVGLNDPDGGLPAVSSYPVQYARGGALLGRIGECHSSNEISSRAIANEAFVVGDYTWGQAHCPGLLYFRINDDLLGDNLGALKLTITIQPAAAEETP